MSTLELDCKIPFIEPWPVWSSPGLCEARWRPDDVAEAAMISRTLQSDSNASVITRTNPPQIPSGLSWIRSPPNGCGVYRATQQKVASGALEEFQLRRRTGPYPSQ